MKEFIYLSISVLLLLSACADADAIYVDESFEQYISAFSTEAAERGISIEKELDVLSVQFVNQNDDIIGQCVHFSNDTKEIRIDQSSWDSTNELGRELLIFHELGHCVLGRDHDNQKDNEGECISIMRESNSACKLVYTSETRAIYLNELFK